MRVELVGTHVTADPFRDLMNRVKGTFYRVSGEVEFEPVAGKTYVVNGALKEEGSSVWIETADTHEVVTTRVSGGK